MLKLHEDFVASHLRSQVAVVQNLIKCIENRDYAEIEYLNNGLRQVELNLRQLRKVITRS